MAATIKFCGGVGAATGACFLLTLERRGKDHGPRTRRILLDCGFLQGVPGADDFNASEFPFQVHEVHTLIISHAHADHIGRIPKLIKAGFSGTIYSTPATRDLAQLMLTDAADILGREAMEQNIQPLYTHDDVRRALSMWKSVPYYETFDLQDGITCTFKDAGHILGSAISELLIEQHDGSVKKFVYTGDLGNSPSLFLRDTDISKDADYVVIESVYGDRVHESKEVRRYKFEQIIKDIIARKRTLVIPAFSLERTQDLLYEINRLVEEGVIDPVPVFIDSPLATKVTGVYRQYSAEFKKPVQEQINGGDDVFDFSKLKFTARLEDSQQIAGVANPKIIIAGSGMSAGGRIMNHEIRYLPDTHATILFVGYQALGTLGRRIVDGARRVRINDHVVGVQAEVATIFGYSSHKDANGLLDFVLKAAEGGKLKNVFTVLGEPRSAMHLAQRIRSYGVHATYPRQGHGYPLDL